MPHSSIDSSLPKPGDFWSTRSSSTHPGFLVLVAIGEDDSLLGYPLFGEANAATSTCFLLRGSPEFECLLDERWVSFEAPVKLDASSLFARLGHSQYALDCLKAFNDGREVPLENGVPMLCGIGDPRETFHRSMTKELARLAGASLLQVSFDRIKNAITLGKVPLREAFEFCLQQHSLNIPDVASIGMAACMPPEKGSLFSRIKRHISSKTARTTLLVIGHEVGLCLSISKEGILCELSCPELTAVELSAGQDGEWLQVKPRSAGCFVTPPLKKLPVRLLFSFDDGTTAPIDLGYDADWG